jgi:hypothetical protein
VGGRKTMAPPRRLRLRCFGASAIPDRGRKKWREDGWRSRESSSLGPNFVLPSELREIVGDKHFFAITFDELPKTKVCQSNYPKLLELL